MYTITNSYIDATFPLGSLYIGPRASVLCAKDHCIVSDVWSGAASPGKVRPRNARCMLRDRETQPQADCCCCCCCCFVAKLSSIFAASFEVDPLSCVSSFGCGKGELADWRALIWSLCGVALFGTLHSKALCCSQGFYLVAACYIFN